MAPRAGTERHILEAVEGALSEYPAGATQMDEGSPEPQGWRRGSS